MSEEKESLKQDQTKESPKVNELSEKDMKEVSGGLGVIQGESPVTRQMGWIEIPGFSGGIEE